MHRRSRSSRSAGTAARPERGADRKPVQDARAIPPYGPRMPHKPPVILHAAEIDRAEAPWLQRLNPRCKFAGTGLAVLAGLRRTGISRARIPPGGESFAYHPHLVEEEWIYILRGRR